MLPPYCAGELRQRRQVFFGRRKNLDSFRDGWPLHGGRSGILFASRLGLQKNAAATGCHTSAYSQCTSEFPLLDLFRFEAKNSRRINRSSLCIWSYMSLRGSFHRVLLLAITLISTGQIPAATLLHRYSFTTDAGDSVGIE